MPHLNLLSCQHTALARLGHWDAARELALEVMRIAGARRGALAQVQLGSPTEGYRHFLRWRVNHFLPGGERWFHRAQLQAEAGDFTAALESLERGYAARDPMMVKLASTVEFRSLASSRVSARCSPECAPGPDAAAPLDLRDFLTRFGLAHQQLG